MLSNYSSFYTLLICNRILRILKKISILGKLGIIRILRMINIIGILGIVGIVDQFFKVYLDKQNFKVSRRFYLTGSNQYFIY